MVLSQSDMRSALHIATTVAYLRPNHLVLPRGVLAFRPPRPPPRLTAEAKVRAFSTGETEIEGSTASKKPSVCTADELHYVSVSNSDWRLALWRYTPPPQAPPRNHPLLLLSGVATNAIGYDLSPESSFARYMCSQGFDTWILEVRGAGLSTQGSDLKEIELSAHAISDRMEATAQTATDGVFPVAESDNSVVKGDLTGIATVWDESKVVTKLTETFTLLSERLSGFLSEGQSKLVSAKFFDQISRLLEDSFLSERFDEIRVKLSSLLEARQNSAVTSQIRDLSQKLVNIIEESERSVSPQLYNLQERFFTTIEDFQNQLELIVKYDWDF
ncbi:N-formylmaleamate deformylase, partial [Actinidia chinensis var. chinensis]